MEEEIYRKKNTKEKREFLKIVDFTKYLQHITNSILIVIDMVQ